MHKKIIVPLLIAFLFGAFAFPGQTAAAKGDFDIPEEIRVALFIKGIETVPSVTLSSSAGLKVGVRHPNGVKTWLELPGAQTIRASIDRYMLSVAETAELKAALELRDKLEPLVQEVYLFTANRSGKNVYRVFAGNFSSLQQARQEQEKLAREPFLKQADMAVKGPLHWSVGTHASENAARQQISALNSKGFEAFLVIQENSAGIPEYSVWVGEEADNASLGQLKNRLTASFPGLKLVPADTGKPYLLLRSEVLPDGNNKQTPHYMFNALGQNMWVSAPQSFLLVKERYGRTYRGAVELTQYNGELAVINQLPLEEYLYSVVSSEMAAGWPLEALKAQAVAARTFAVKQGMKYGVAHISDTTIDQAYKGMGVEFAAAIRAVDETAGEVLADESGLVLALYHSNAGGMTADPAEIWGNSLDAVKVVPSPDDGAQEGKLVWNRVVLPSGIVGYVRSDYTEATGETNAAGLPVLRGTESNVNVRRAPYVDNANNPPIAQIQAGDRMVLIGQAAESTAYQWIRGPFSGETLRNMINARAKKPLEQPLKTLEASKRGSSGRVTEIKANGQVIQVDYPDAYRTILGSLPSGRFDIEEMARYTIEGAGGKTRTLPEQAGPLYVLSGKTASANTRPSVLDMEEWLAMNADREVRLFSATPQFRFIGWGFGHGLGMSQWGAKELAEHMGYDYQQILQYYYHGVTVLKD
jgi:stage II sporulation protein D